MKKAHTFNSAPPPPPKKNHQVFKDSRWNYWIACVDSSVVHNKSPLLESQVKSSQKYWSHESSQVIAIFGQIKSSHIIVQVKSSQVIFSFKSPQVSMVREL